MGQESAVDLKGSGTCRGDYASDAAEGGGCVERDDESFLNPKAYQALLGGLTWYTKETDIRFLLRGLGIQDILDVHIFENRVNGQSKGFCVVQVGSPASLKRIFKMGRRKILHHEVIVKPATVQSIKYLENEALLNGARKFGIENDVLQWGAGGYRNQEPNRNIYSYRAPNSQPQNINQSILRYCPRPINFPVNNQQQTQYYHFTRPYQNMTWYPNYSVQQHYIQTYAYAHSQQYQYQNQNLFDAPSQNGGTWYSQPQSQHHAYQPKGI